MEATYRRALVEGEHAGSRYALVVPRHVPAGLAGLRLGRRAGSSLEFRDHREYQPGDDLRHIDWLAYARSDKLMLKVYREEVTPHLDLLLDGSRSMALADTEKARAALGVAAALVAAAANAGFSHAAWTTGAVPTPIAHGSEPPSSWEGIRFDQTSSPADALGAAPPPWRPKGLRVLISDLLWIGDPMAALDALCRGAASAAVVQLLAAADVDPPRRGNLRLVDCETDEVKEVFVDAAAQSRYREALHRHQENWAVATRRVGAVMATLVAERVVTDWNLGDLVAAEILTVT